MVLKPEAVRSNALSWKSRPCYVTWFTSTAVYSFFLRKSVNHCLMFHVPINEIGWLGDFPLRKLREFDIGQGNVRKIVVCYRSWDSHTINITGASSAEQYGRDGKFRPTLKMGWKIVYFPPHFWWPDVPPPPKKCTKLHRFAPIFSTISRRPEPQNWGGVPPQIPPLDERPPSHFFRASAAAELVYC